jgi:hypothetical protein
MTLMAERDADYYQAHKDDPEEWSDSRPGQRPPKRRLAAMISVRFTPEEEEEIRRAAQSEGKSVSQFIRETSLKQARSSSSKAVTVPISAIPSTSTGSYGGTSRTLEGTAVIEVSAGQPLPTTVLRGH